MIGLCTLLTVGDRFTDMEDFGYMKEDFFKSFLELPNGIPTHDTFNRVFSAIDPEQFVECFLLWVKEICPTLKGDNIALDGKALRGAVNEGKKMTYIISAWASGHELVVGQSKVEEKSNEITAIPQLLRSLDIEGCTITIDAMGTQKNIAKIIKQRKADYVLALKGNQGNMHKEVQKYFESSDEILESVEALPKGWDYHETTDFGHGRIETRRYWQSSDIQWLEDKKKWEGLQSFIMVESTRKKGTEITTERRYYISSLGLNAEKTGQAIRDHWGIENKVHWVLDVSLSEDQSRARSGNAAQNLALLRRITLNLLKSETSKDISMRRKRLWASGKGEYLRKLLGI